MFTQQVPPEVFDTQAEFMRVFDTNRDFAWWAESLVTEETKELNQAVANEPIGNVLKELADVVYVVCGFYNCLPPNGQKLLSDERNLQIQQIITAAQAAIHQATYKFEIPFDIVLKAFLVVHKSNMSKLDADGNVLRREDGKVLKGPNYEAPDMSPIVEELEAFHATRNSKGIADA